MSINDYLFDYGALNRASELPEGRLGQVPIQQRPSPERALGRLLDELQASWAAGILPADAVSGEAIREGLAALGRSRRP